MSIAIPVREARLLIRFTSSLTAEDENRLAPALVKALSSILDLLPVAYAIRIETSDSQVYQHRGSPDEAASSGLANIRGEVSGHAALEYR